MNSANKTESRNSLVLGGGGSAGNAWLIGIIAGLLDGGVDVTTADRIVGTSAGATAAAQVTSADPAELFAATLDFIPVRGGGGAVPDGRPAATRPSVSHLEATGKIIAESADPADMRRRIGAHALELAAADPHGRDRWRAMVAARLPAAEWPTQPIALTAVDAETGESLVFNRESGVELVDAVAASTAGGPAYRIGDRHFIDGGYRTNPDNADLARGFERILVVSPLGGRSRFPEDWGLRLENQVAELRASGSAVETIFPDAAALEAFGDNLMDPSTRPPAARAGHAQGTELAGSLDALWW